MADSSKSNAITPTPHGNAANISQADALADDTGAQTCMDAETRLMSADTGTVAAAATDEGVGGTVTGDAALDAAGQLDVHDAAPAEVPAAEDATELAAISEPASPHVTACAAALVQQNQAVMPGDDAKVASEYPASTSNQPAAALQHASSATKTPTAESEIATVLASKPVADIASAPASAHTLKAASPEGAVKDAEGPADSMPTSVTAPAPAAALGLSPQAKALTSDTATVPAMAATLAESVVAPGAAVEGSADTCPRSLFTDQQAKASATPVAATSDWPILTQSAKEDASAVAAAPEPGANGNAAIPLTAAAPVQTLHRKGSLPSMTAVPEQAAECSKSEAVTAAAAVAAARDQAADSKDASASTGAAASQEASEVAASEENTAVAAAAPVQTAGRNDYKAATAATVTTTAAETAGAAAAIPATAALPSQLLARAMQAVQVPKSGLPLHKAPPTPLQIPPASVEDLQLQAPPPGMLSSQHLARDMIIGAEQDTQPESSVHEPARQSAEQSSEPDANSALDADSQQALQSPGSAHGAHSSSSMQSGGPQSRSLLHSDQPESSGQIAQSQTALRQNSALSSQPHDSLLSLETAAAVSEPQAVSTQVMTHSPQSSSNAESADPVQVRQPDALNCQAS